jgi:hypothetical protein
VSAITAGLTSGITFNSTDGLGISTGSFGCGLWIVATLAIILKN